LLACLLACLEHAKRHHRRSKLTDGVSIRLLLDTFPFYMATEKSSCEYQPFVSSIYPVEIMLAFKLTNNLHSHVEQAAQQTVIIGYT
jgi:hypothetical protein